MTKLLVAILALCSGALYAKTICLVTHGPLNEIEQKLLQEPSGSFKEAAEQEGYVVMEGEGTVFAYPKNLYNLAYMDQVMRGYVGLRAIAESDSPFRKLSELDPGERNGIRAIFGDSSVLSEYGPLVGKDDTVVQLWTKREITLTNGRLDVVIRLPEVNKPMPSDFFNEAPSEEEKKKFEQGPAKRWRKQSYPDALCFHFKVSSNQTSSARTSAITYFSEKLSEILETQRKAFSDAYDALMTSIMNGKKAEQGASWLTLDDATKRYLEDLRDNRFTTLGFDHKDGASAFFHDARIKSTNIQAFVGVGIKNVGGAPLVTHASVAVKRNN